MLRWLTLLMQRPPFNTFPELQSDRILLRKHVPADAPHVTDVTFFMHVPAKDVHEVLEMHQKIEARYQSGESIQWAIVDRTTNTIVGNCGYYRGFADETGEIGYVMKENFRRMGYMSEAVKLIVDFGFDVMKLTEIFATTAPDNIASHGVLLKNGFIAQGLNENDRLRFHKTMRR